MVVVTPLYGFGELGRPWIIRMNLSPIDAYQFPESVQIHSPVHLDYPAIANLFMYNSLSFSENRHECY